AFPAPVYEVGPCLWEPPDSRDAWDALRSRFPDPDAPVVYVQQGRTFRSPGFWAQLVEALAGEPVQVVASTGRMDEPVGVLPPNFVAEPHVPQGMVMRRARAVVAGGTTTPVLGALVHGLPAVLLPGGGEMVDNTEKVVSAGCALSLDPRGLTPAALKQAIRQVLDDVEMRRKCREIRRAMAPAAGFGMAAERIDQLAATSGATYKFPAALAVG
ncbi:MAG: hypothetical protein JO306_07740, partial [Gemmatimonadetes bacterium]|nr:hypothetical protein [Gemmatimonadota bacterium]